ncbi:DUF4190 domain-containing protein [Clavibacter sepedonicus]|nr:MULTISPECIES: DUF4190 domain-containing protein [Clavibacter]MBD5382194.1 DUF4190 domain-containing protein [Clavibacter sp.]OQJ48811.1 hypothetical protein B5P19_11550 [Clavibacter sepedonicus]OQJ54357.1 hypothetical protein B5P20_09735 [Clavibacter sepedonicus]UUK65915.1 DUF4190 domain-containing protein [Clavibacter sepedonicus]
MTDARDPNSTPEQHSYPAPPPAPEGGYATPYAPAAPAGPSGGKGLAIASLIVSIVAFLGAFIPFLNYVVFIPAIVAIVLAIVALARHKAGKPLALAGLIVGVLALVLSVILAVVYTVGFAAAVSESLPRSEGGSRSSAAPLDETEEEAGPAVGTRENPAPIGTVVTGLSGGSPEWEVTLGAPVLDANAAVTSENMFNDPAPAGTQYAMVPVTVKYVGTESASPMFEIGVEYVSAAGTTHTTSDSFAVAPEPQFDSINELFPGASGTGNVVIAIPTADAAAGTWAVRPGILADPYYFAAQ